MGRISEFSRVDVDKLIPYINNAKKHSEDQITRIASSIREFGFLSPVVVDNDFNVIVGHGRIMAAKKLGIKDVPCVFADGLTDAQRKAYILADNRLSEFAEWDMELVTNELEALQDSNIDCSYLDFNIEEYPDILDLDDDEENDDKTVVRLVFQTYKDYALHEKAIKDFADGIGATVTV